MRAAKPSLIGHSQVILRKLTHVWCLKFATRPKGDWTPAIEEVALEVIALYDGARTPGLRSHLVSMIEEAAVTFSEFVGIFEAGVEVGLFERLRQATWLDLAAEIAPYLRTLIIKYDRSLTIDDYGIESQSGWKDELQDFRTRVLGRPAHDEVLGRCRELAIGDDDIDALVTALVTQGSHPGELRRNGLGLATGASAKGGDFEDVCADILRRSGWAVYYTRRTGDHGIDIKAVQDGIVAVFQCKAHERPVGNSAVQEIFAGQALSLADIAVVVSLSGFTEHAREAAAATGVHLVTIDGLPELALRIRATRR